MTAMTMDRLCAYLRECESIADPIVVVGHEAPDTDAAISSVMEAWRRYVSGEPAIPFLRCACLPKEIEAAFGKAAYHLLMGADGDWLLEEPGLKVVLTDHHEDPTVAGQIVAIVDHHLPAPGTTFDGIDTCIRRVGAATTLVALRWREQGLIPDEAVARALLAGILMDTDGLSPHKTASEDLEAVAWLTPLYGAEPMGLYAALQELLLGETHVRTLYRRDYRLYPEADVGFAILKVWQHNPPDKAEVRRCLEDDVDEHERRLCVAKIALYNEDGIQEETYLVDGDPVACDRFLAAVCAEAQGAAVRIADDEVLLPAGCPRHGRKWYARRLAEILG